MVRWGSIKDYRRTTFRGTDILFSFKLGLPASLVLCLPPSTYLAREISWQIATSFFYAEDSLSLGRIFFDDTCLDRMSWENSFLDMSIHSEICYRNTRHCSNNALIGRDLLKYQNKCQMSDSLGWRSAHNCKNRGGSSYLCVQCQRAHCYVSIITSYSSQPWSLPVINTLTAISSPLTTPLVVI